MTEKEQENKEKRKMIPLTREEYLTFFFFPGTHRKSYSRNFNRSEDLRFKKHGFNTKSSQAQYARILGLLFYGILLFTAAILLKHYQII